MSINKFDKAIEIISNLIRKNTTSQKGKKTFPVSCVISNLKGKVLSQKINEKKSQKIITTIIMLNF